MLWWGLLQLTERPGMTDGADDTAGTPISARVTRVLMTEESIYGLILVSGMIVVSQSLVGTSANALLTVVVTVAVFFFAHVFAGTLARLAGEEGQGDLRHSIRGALHHSRGMLVAAVIPILILGLGVTRVIDDESAIWAALLVDVVLLGILGWLAVARWSTSTVLRLTSAVITAGFGVVITALKVLLHH